MSERSRPCIAGTDQPQQTSASLIIAAGGTAAGWRHRQIRCRGRSHRLRAAPGRRLRGDGLRPVDLLAAPRHVSHHQLRLLRDHTEHQAQHEPHRDQHPDAEQRAEPPLPAAPAASRDLDLLIRTAGEMRLSNFMLWQASYAEIVITRTLWPDFRKRHLYSALREYQARTRRFGGRPGR